MKYVDVNVFVYWLGDDPAFGETATNIIEQIEGGERAATSSLTPWQTHVVLTNAKAKGYTIGKLMSKLRQLAFLQVEPLTLVDFENAAKIMPQYRIDLEDSLHLTVAQRLGITEIYTNDKDFARTPLKPQGFR